MEQAGFKGFLGTDMMSCYVTRQLSIVLYIVQYWYGRVDDEDCCGGCLLLASAALAFSNLFGSCTEFGHPVIQDRYQ